jgi:hypothetical protein
MTSQARLLTYWTAVMLVGVASSAAGVGPVPSGYVGPLVFALIWVGMGVHRAAQSEHGAAAAGSGRERWPHRAWWVAGLVGGATVVYLLGRAFS